MTVTDDMELSFISLPLSYLKCSRPRELSHLPVCEFRFDRNETEQCAVGRTGNVTLYAQAHTHTHTCTHADTHVHTCTHTRAHVHTHVHTSSSLHLVLMDVGQDPVVTLRHKFRVGLTWAGG